MKARFKSQLRRRRGSILIVTLGVLIVLTSLVLLMARSARTEANISANHAARLRADAIAHGAIEYARVVVTNSKGTLPDDSQVASQAVKVGDGYFWFVKRDFTEGAAGPIYGITDEAGRISINGASATVLSRLPNMTSDIAAAIVDWRDADDNAQQGGAESSYYLALPTPYQAKNAPFESVDELLMVKDITPTVLYGSDPNLNGVADAGDASPDRPTELFSALDRGLAAYVTAFSVEPNTDASGQRRVNVNDANAQLVPVLSDAVSGARLGEVLTRARQGRPFVSTIDFYYRTGMTIDEFRKVVDRLTTNAQQTSTGLVNVNSAPREVLAALPNMTDADADAIITRRASDGGITDISVLTEILTREKATAIGAMVTTKSYRCSVDVVAADGTGRAFKRYYVVLDTQTSPVKVVYCRDQTNLGWPLDTQILADLRQGKAPADAMTITTGTTTSGTSTAK